MRSFVLGTLILVLLALTSSGLASGSRAMTQPDIGTVRTLLDVNGQETAFVIPISSDERMQKRLARQQEWRKEHIERFLGLLKTEEDPDTRRHLLFELSFANGTSARSVAEQLSVMLPVESDEDTRIAYLTTLSTLAVQAGLPDAAILGIIAVIQRQMASDSSWNVKVQAAGRLVWFGDMQGEAVLRKVIDTQPVLDPNTFESIPVTLQRMNTESTKNALRMLMQRTIQDGVRLNVLQSAYQLGLIELTELLQGVETIARKSPSIQAKIRALSALFFIAGGQPAWKSHIRKIVKEMYETEEDIGIRQHLSLLERKLEAGEYSCPNDNEPSPSVSDAHKEPLEMDAYNRQAVVNYANTWWNSCNHTCGTYSSCTPWSYWGSECCGYPSQGGDCANFVSQSVLAGGHPNLNGGTPCRGYPCGKEEIGAKNLGDCLVLKGWTRTCGYKQAPPTNIQAGDVLVYHASSCSNYTAHATVVTTVSGSDVQISCHSSNQHNKTYTYLASSHPYYEWLHNPTTVAPPSAKVTLNEYPKEVVVNVPFNVKVYYETNFYEHQMLGKVVIDVKETVSQKVLATQVFDNNGKGVQGPSNTLNFNFTLSAQTDSPIYFLVYFTTLSGGYSDRLSEASSSQDPTSVIIKPSAFVEITKFPETVSVGGPFTVTVDYSTNLHQLNEKGKLIIDVKDMATNQILVSAIYDNDGKGLQGPDGQKDFSLIVTTTAKQIYFLAYFTYLDGDYNNRLSSDSTTATPTDVASLPWAEVTIPNPPEVVKAGLPFSVPVYYQTNLYYFNMLGKMVIEVRDHQTGNIISEAVFDNDGLGVTGPEGNVMFLLRIDAAVENIYFRSYFTMLDGGEQERLAEYTTSSVPTAVTPALFCGLYPFRDRAANALICWGVLFIMIAFLFYRIRRDRESR
jgi:hypothetical protein